MAGSHQESDVMQENVVVNYDISEGGIATSGIAFADVVMQNNYKFFNRITIDVDILLEEIYALIEANFDEIHFYEKDKNQNLVITAEYKEAICMLSFFKNSATVNFTFGGDDAAKLSEYALEMQSIFPLPKEVPNDEIKVKFWFMSSNNGPVSRSRMLHASHWDEITRNYTGETNNQLETLFSLKEPADGGKLILLHGQPGGGKSHAIRALAQEWDWCNFEYLLDPDAFFASAQYMLHVLLGEEGREGRAYPGAPAVAQRSPWKVLIAEDTDEFLRADAKERSGQGLSRLLNLADGMVGQGLKVLVLLTTNEPMANLHPAVVRKGRCLANIEFSMFSREEARNWLQDDSIKLDQSTYSLADLYDMQRINQQIVKPHELVATGQYL